MDDLDAQELVAMNDQTTVSQEMGPSAARKYLFALLAGGLGAGAVSFGLLAGMEKYGHLPPPAFANNICVDEKLHFLRTRHPAPPNFLVIGSSVAWRHVDSETFVRTMPGTRPLNAAFCGLTATQTVQVAKWMLDRHPSVRRVLMVLSPQDLTRCKSNPHEAFDLADADDFVYKQASRWQYYFRYFDPVSLGRAAMTIQVKRDGLRDFDDLVFTAYGDGPLDTALSRHLGYEERDPLDPACFDALKSFIKQLRSEGRTLAIVTNPVHPEWVAQDERSAFLDESDAQLASLAKSEGLFYWNAATEWETPHTSFIDAIHLRWSAAGEFTAALAARLSASNTHGGSAR